MPFKLLEFLERFMNGAFLITLTQLEKSGSTAKVFIPLEILKLIPLSKLEIVHVFSRHFHVPIWRVLLPSLSADDFELNSKSAYIPKCIYLGINMCECTSVVIKAFKKFFLKQKNHQDYIRVFTTFITNLKTFSHSGGSTYRS